MSVAIAIDRVVVETELERAAAARIPEALRAAFQLLAERLARSPWARLGIATLVIELLESEPIAAAELLGPRGAELLAERLWSRLAARLAEGA